MSKGACDYLDDGDCGRCTRSDFSPFTCLAQCTSYKHKAKCSRDAKNINIDFKTIPVYLCSQHLKLLSTALFRKIYCRGPQNPPVKLHYNGQTLVDINEAVYKSVFIDRVNPLKLGTSNKTFNHPILGPITVSNIETKFNQKYSLVFEPWRLIRSESTAAFSFLYREATTNVHIITKVETNIYDSQETKEGLVQNWAADYVASLETRDSKVPVLSICGEVSSRAVVGDTQLDDATQVYDNATQLYSIMPRFDGDLERKDSHMLSNIATYFYLPNEEWAVFHIVNTVKDQVLCLYDNNNNHVYTDLWPGNIFYKVNNTDSMFDYTLFLGGMGSKLPLHGTENLYFSTYPPPGTEIGTYYLTSQKNRIKAMGYQLGVLFLTLMNRHNTQVLQFISPDEPDRKITFDIVNNLIKQNFNDARLQYLIQNLTQNVQGNSGTKEIKNLFTNTQGHLVRSRNITTDFSHDLSQRSKKKWPESAVKRNRYVGPHMYSVNN